MKLSKFYPLKKQILFKKTYYVHTKQFNHCQFRSAKRRKYNYEQKLQKGHLPRSVGTTNIILVSSCRSIFNDSSTFFSLAKIHIKSLKF